MEIKLSNFTETELSFNVFVVNTLILHQINRIFTQMLMNQSGQYWKEFSKCISYQQ